MKATAQSMVRLGSSNLPPHLLGLIDDEPPLSLQSAEGHRPGERELSLRWLAGTMLTGLTSIFLMGAALFIAFDGVGDFATPHQALMIPAPPTPSTVLEGKTDRARPILATRSERDLLEASVLLSDDTTSIIRNATFIRVAATLATSQTALTDDVAAYRPQDYIDVLEEQVELTATVSTEVVGQAVDAEVAVVTSELPMSLKPPSTIDDAAAAAFVASIVFDHAPPQNPYALAYAPSGEVSTGGAVPQGIAENVTMVPMRPIADEGTRSTEVFVKIEESLPLETALLRNGFTANTSTAVIAAMRNIFPATTLAARSRLRILLGPSRGGAGLIPYRLSIYVHDNATNSDIHTVTVSLTDAGRYVIALAPPDVPFAEESTEQISAGNLPSIYQSIWETGRRNEIDDVTIARIVALVAYDTDLTQRIQPGDTIEILQSVVQENEPAQLLYVGFTLGSATRNFYRFQTADGAVGYFDQDGQSGRRFMMRRPLEGGGRLTSAMGLRVDPFSGGRASHEGTDFAAPRGTPIYAAADGTIEMAQWFSSYGRYVRISHLNGYQTAYAHMNQIANGIAPGVRVRQGDVIGYVGSTGRSTGNHLHYELEINGRVADPLEVRLPRERSLPGQYIDDLGRTIEQVRSIMEMPPATPAREI